MDKVDALWIAACKSNIEAREVALDVVYDEYYVRGLTGDIKYSAINGLLTSIVDQYCKVTASKAIEKLNLIGLYSSERLSYQIRVRNFLLDTIAYTETSKYSEYLESNINSLRAEIITLIEKHKEV